MSRVFPRASDGENLRFADFATELGGKRLYVMRDLDGPITDTAANVYAQKSQKGKKSYSQTKYQRIVLNHRCRYRRSTPS